MKKITIRNIILTSIFSASFILVGTSFSAPFLGASNPPQPQQVKAVKHKAKKTTIAKQQQQTKIPATAATIAPISQSKIIQDFNSDNLGVQFRYDGGKLIGIRLMNNGSTDMMVSALNTHYILGPNDYVVLNPPNLTSLQIFHSPYLEPLTTTEMMFPGRWSKQEVYLIPKNISDKIVATSGVVHK